MSQRVLFFSTRSFRPFIGAVSGCLLLWLALAPSTLAQGKYKIIRPAERSQTEKVIVRRATQSTKATLAVLLDPIISGKVMITDSRGQVRAESATDAQGRVDFELARGQAYVVKATSPGYLGKPVKSSVLTPRGDIVRVKLTPQSASLTLPLLPNGAQVFLNDQLRATSKVDESIVINELAPGTYKLLIRHPEYNDYTDTVADLQAGSEIQYGRILLTRVAKLTVESQPGAAVLIDGELQGKVNTTGRVQINYELEQAGEHSVAIELTGYQPWSRRETLTPGPRVIAAKLEPVVTSVGASDSFDNLAQWQAPAQWQAVQLPLTLPSGRIVQATRLQVNANASLGSLKDKLYRDFEAVFTVWIPDGKGASWAVRADSSGKNYYLFHLTGPQPQADLLPRKFYTFLVRDGVMTEVSTTTEVLVEINQKDSFTIKLTVRGNTVQHTITSNAPGKGEESDLGLWTQTDSDREKFLYGSFGFRSLKGETFQVDDFNLTPLNTP